VQFLAISVLKSVFGLMKHPVHAGGGGIDEECSSSTLLFPSVLSHSLFVLPSLPAYVVAKHWDRDVGGGGTKDATTEPTRQQRRDSPIHAT
jgi:hypothetical protein